MDPGKLESLRFGDTTTSEFLSKMSSEKFARFELSWHLKLVAGNRVHLSSIRMKVRKCQIGNLKILLENFAQEKNNFFFFPGVNFRVAKQGRESPTIIVMGLEDFSDLTREHY